MEEATKWHEDDRFWGTFARVIFGEKRWAAAHEEIERVIAMLGAQPGAAVLDLCCGPGRHSLELARRGFRVTGVDRTRAYLDQARERAASEGLNVELIEDDMRRFCRPETYDGAINLFTAFGYFEDPAEDRQAAGNIYRSLKPDGVLVMDLIGKEIIARVFRERDWSEVNGAILLEERKVSHNWSWIENRWILLKDDKRQEFTVSHRLYSAVELSSLLKGCGFRRVECFGDLAGAPYDQKAKRLIAVATK